MKRSSRRERVGPEILRLTTTAHSAQRALSVIIGGRDIGAAQERPQRGPGFAELCAGARSAVARRLFGALLQCSLNASLQRLERPG